MRSVAGSRHSASPRGRRAGTHAEFGNGTISPSFFAQASNAGTPVQVVMGAYHTCVLYADRTIKCAGWNANGQIGNNTAGGDVTTFVSPTF